jgi:hypothetical protein
MGGVFFLDVYELKLLPVGKEEISDPVHTTFGDFVNPSNISIYRKLLDRVIIKTY